MPDRGARRSRWSPEKDREYQRRRKQAADRERQEREDFDPTPATDEDWTIGDRSGLKKLRPPEPVGDALGAFLARSGWADRVRTTRLLDDWAGIVGPNLAEHAEPMRIEKGILHLRVSSNSWATQLTWLEQTIVEKVNERAGTALVRAVRVHVG